MYYESGNITQTLIIFTIVSVLLFFICREIMCWYFKINERLDQQRQTNVLLEKIYNELREKNPNTVQEVSVDSPISLKSESAVSGSGKSNASGKGNIEFDYERLLSMSVEQLNQRGMLELEDHNWESANAYFSESLNKEPHNGEAHLGLFLAEKRQPNVDHWLDEIKKKYCCEMEGYEKEVIDVIENFDEHVQSQEEKYELKGYLSKEEIRQLYCSIDHTYVSSANGWTRRMQCFETMVNGRHLRRVLCYTKGSLNQKIMNTLEEVLNYMNSQFESVLEQDRIVSSRLYNEAPIRVSEADSQARMMSIQAKSRKEEMKRNRREKLTRGITGTKEQLGAFLKSSRQ